MYGAADVVTLATPCQSEQPAHVENKSKRGTPQAHAHSTQSCAHAHTLESARHSQVGSKQSAQLRTPTNTHTYLLRDPDGLNVCGAAAGQHESRSNIRLAHVATLGQVANEDCQSSTTREGEHGNSPY
jgi:hypothetical protein